MKNILIVLLFTTSTIYFAQSTPNMDGTFDGTGVWGSPIATADGNAGWSNANVTNIYVVNDANYIYFGASITASNWMSWCFIINAKTGGTSTDSWSRDITYTHSNLPDYDVRGNFNNGWTEIHSWNGSAWTGGGTDIGTAEHGDNISGTDITGWVEVRVSRSTITETVGDIQFFITGDQTTHGSFDACPDDDNTAAWTGTAAHSDLVNYATSTPLPVELSSFTATVVGKNVKLNWQTATEVNNYGFEVQRSSGKSAFSVLGFVQGHGNSNSPKQYTYTDGNVEEGAAYIYRLKQIDVDGAFEYSDEVRVSMVNNSKSLVLKQNFPNPFNPSTAIKFSFNKATKAKLTVYNSLGQTIAELFNRTVEAGKIYSVNFDGSKYSSGIYFYKLITPEKTAIKKMLLIK